MLETKRTLKSTFAPSFAGAMPSCRKILCWSSCRNDAFWLFDVWVASGGVTLGRSSGPRWLISSCRLRYAAMLAIFCCAASFSAATAASRCASLSASSRRRSSLRRAARSVTARSAAASRSRSRSLAARSCSARFSARFRARRRKYSPLRTEQILSNNVVMAFGSADRGPNETKLSRRWQTRALVSFHPSQFILQP